MYTASLAPSHSFLVLECVGSKKEGPGTQYVLFAHVLQKSHESHINAELTSPDCYLSTGKDLAIIQLIR